MTVAARMTTQVCGLREIETDMAAAREGYRQLHKGVLSAFNRTAQSEAKPLTDKLKQGKRRTGMLAMRSLRRLIGSAPLADGVWVGMAPLFPDVLNDSDERALWLM